MREIVGEAESSDLRKPVFVGLAGSDEKFLANFVENVIRKTTYHSEQCQLLQMEESLTWQTTCQKEDYRLWSMGV